MKPFNPRLPTRVKTDYNGFEGATNRDPALGCSLWQLHGKEWFPCGYGSRFLRASERNLLKRESAYSSSLGESLAFDFALNHFYPELSQVDSFEVLCDARNLTYWKTSDSPLLVRLRAKISGKFNLQKITVRHIPRRLNNLSDSLGRLAIHPSPSAEDLSLSTYEYLASDLISLPSFRCSNSVPNWFTAQDFSLQELQQFREAKISVRGPISRHLHGRTLYLVPEASQNLDLWENAHLSDDGSGAHFTKSRTRANLSHLHWKKKSAWISRHWRACEVCAASRASHDTLVLPITEYTGEAMRPTHYGQAVAFDTTGPKPSNRGPLYLATSLDGHTGLFDAIIIDTPNAPNGIKAVEHFRRTGKSPEIALFDRAKAYLDSRAFRSYLDEIKTDPRYSKGWDPRYMYVSSLV